MVGEVLLPDDRAVRRSFRVRVLRLSVIFVLAIMSGFSLILLIVGSLATGATRHQVYTGFRSRLGGRIAMGFVSVTIKTPRILRWRFLVCFEVLRDCLHAADPLVIGDGQHDRPMHRSLHPQISLHRGLGITHCLRLAQYRFACCLLDPGNLRTSSTKA